MPSTRKFTAAAPAISQLNTWTFAGAWIIGETITVAYGGRTWVYTIASATIATFLAALQTAYANLSSTNYPDFYEQTCGNTATTMTLTSKVAGRPFTVTITTNSVGGTIDGGAGDTGVVTTASSGGNDYSIATNWNPVGVPVTGDSVDLTGLTSDILYGLDQHTVTLVALFDDAARTGHIGLPENSANDYPEYRPTYLQTGITTGSISGISGRTKIDTYTIQTALTVTAAGAPADAETIYAVRLKGTHASNSLYITQGTVDSHMTLLTLSASFKTVRNTDVILNQTGTVGTLTQNGGTVNCSGNVTTWVYTGGVPTLSGSATATTIKVLTAANAPLTFYWISNGTVTTYTGSAGSTLDTAADLRARTCTNSNLESGAVVNDPATTITFTNPTYLRACGFEDVTVHRGRDIHASL